MTEETITLAFIARKLDQLLDESIVTNARIDYIEAGQVKLEAGLKVLTAEVRALRRQVARIEENQ
jgi:hypothetical protein